MIRPTIRFATLALVQILALASLAHGQGGLSQAVLQVSS